MPGSKGGKPRGFLAVLNLVHDKAVETHGMVASFWNATAADLSRVLESLREIERLARDCRNLLTQIDLRLRDKSPKED